MMITFLSILSLLLALALIYICYSIYCLRKRDIPFAAMRGRVYSFVISLILIWIINIYLGFCL